MKAKVGLCWGIVCAAMAWGAMAAERADFTTGEGTNGWTISATEFLSPTYASAVDRISLSYSGAAGGSATVSAITNGGGESPVATLSAAATAAAFDFPETTDFRAFRIVAQNGWTLTSFSAEVSSATIDAPGDVTISNNITGTSFDAYWNPVAGAIGYKVYVWTNVTVGASAGTQVWVETMPGATNASSTTRMSDQKFNACFEHAGWTRADKAGYPTGEDGTIRIGTTGDNGWIQTPSINDAADGMAVCFMAKATATNTKSMDIVVERVSGESVYPAGTATLSTDMQEFVVPLSEWGSGDCIRINSLTNGDRRTIIGTVSVVSGRTAGREEADYIINGRDVGEVTSYSISELPSVPVRVAVAAYGRRGAESVKTATQVVDLSNPDKVSMLNACPISSLTDWSYIQNFDSLASFDGKEWLNGTTLQYWQAWLDGDAVTEFKSGATAGMRKCSSNDVTCALGGLGKKGSYVYWGLAFTNDTEYAVKLSEVVYAAQQWSLQNSVEQPLSLSVLVTNRLDWISSFGENWKVCCSTAAQCSLPEGHPTPVATSVSFSPSKSIVVGSGEVLLLKWTLEPQSSGSSAMMAIDDLTVTFTSGFRSFVIHLVDGGK